MPRTITSRSSFESLDREQGAVVGESHWTVTGRGHVALGDGPQAVPREPSRDRTRWYPLGAQKSGNGDRQDDGDRAPAL